MLHKSLLTAIFSLFLSTAHALSAEPILVEPALEEMIGAASVTDVDRETSSGWVHGFIENGIYQYKGIPYAKPPLGELRFSPPEQAEYSSNTIDATEFGPACLQRNTITLPKAGVSEDCLTLNIWTPTLNPSKKLPVMVFLHGGGYLNGNGGDDRFDTASFSKNGNVVYITLNYRLGILGYLALEPIAGVNYRDSVNNALKDQMMALKWIKNNIHQFSGDADNITLFGQSAGAGSAMGILGTDRPDQWIKKVIIQSTPALLTYEQALLSSSRYQKAAHSLNITTLADWRSAPVEELMMIMSEVEQQVGFLAEDRLHGPVYGEGLLIPKNIITIIEDGNAANIDVMIGTTMDEVRAYTEDEPDLCNQSAFNNVLFDENLLLSLGAWGATQVYRANPTGVAPNRLLFTEGKLLLSIADDIFFRIPAVNFAKAHRQAAHRGRTYSYIFDYKSNLPGDCRHNSAGHALEVPFVFNTLNSALNIQRLGKPRNEVDKQNRFKLARAMQDVWIRFAHTGNPNKRKSQFWANVFHKQDYIGWWPNYNAVSKPTMLLSTKARVLNAPFWFEQALLKAAGADNLDF